MKKSELYMVLDCETATLPFIKQMDLSPSQRQRVSIAKPLIYDIGWILVTNKGEIVKKVSYLVQETFFVPQVFNTAYYREKRPMYMEKLRNKEITPQLWDIIETELLEDCRRCDFVSAYNAMFDFKKAIPFTHAYIANLYSDNYDKWEYGQRKSAEKIAANSSRDNDNRAEFDPDNFLIGEEKFPLVDLWAIATKEIVNNFLYKRVCTNMPMLSASGQFFKTSAESVYRYINKDYDFNEEHTALADAEIETEILMLAVKRGKKIEIGISYFPFRELGTTYDFCMQAMREGKKVKREAIENVIDAMEEYFSSYSENGLTFGGFEVMTARNIYALTKEYNRRFGENRKSVCPEYEILLEIRRCENRINNAKTPEKKEEFEKELAELKAKLAIAVEAE